MNTKILSLVVLMTFTMGAFSIVPAYASTPQQVSVRIDVQPCPGAPASYALNSTNFAAVQYIQNGETQTIDVYQNTTVSVDAGSIVVFPYTTNLQVSIPLGLLSWVAHMPNSFFVNKAMNVAMSYCPVLESVNVKMLFGNSAYTPSMGIIVTPQFMMDATGFNYLKNGVVVTDAGTEITTNSTLSMPSQWYNSTGVWEIHGTNTFNVASAIGSRTLPVFDYTFTPNTKPSLPTWKFNSSTPLAPGGVVTVTLSAPYPFYTTSLSITPNSVSYYPCSANIVTSNISCAVSATSAGKMRITAVASVRLSVLALSPGGTSATVTTSVANITSVTTVPVIQPVSPPWWYEVPWWVWLLVIVAAGVVSLVLLYHMRKKRREDERGVQA